MHLYRNPEAENKGIWNEACYKKGLLRLGEHYFFECRDAIKYVEKQYQLKSGQGTAMTEDGAVKETIDKQQTSKKELSSIIHLEEVVVTSHNHIHTHTHRVRSVVERSGDVDEQLMTHYKCGLRRASRGESKSGEPRRGLYWASDFNWSDYEARGWRKLHPGDPVYDAMKQFPGDLFVHPTAIAEGRWNVVSYRSNLLTVDVDFFMNERDVKEYWWREEGCAVDAARKAAEEEKKMLQEQKQARKKLAVKINEKQQTVGAKHDGEQTKKRQKLVQNVAHQAYKGSNDEQQGYISKPLTKLMKNNVSSSSSSSSGRSALQATVIAQNNNVLWNCKEAEIHDFLQNNDSMGLLEFLLTKRRLREISVFDANTDPVCKKLNRFVTIYVNGKYLELWNEECFQSLLIDEHYFDNLAGIKLYWERMMYHPKRSS